MSFNFTPFSAQLTVPHTTYPLAKDWVPNVPYNCANPMDESNVTQILAISVGSISNPISYNTTSLYANLGACVKIILVNNVNIQHSFTIDKVSSTGNYNNSVDDADLTKAQINSIDMDIMNSTDNVGFGPGINAFYAWMPQVQSQFKYYCGISGHEAADEKGTLFVGASSTPADINSGVGIFVIILIAILGIIGLTLFLSKQRGKNQNHPTDSSFVNKQNNMIQKIKENANNSLKNSFCLHCGSRTEPNDVFCQNCGSRVS